MNLARILTRCNIGLDALLITVEVHLSNGLPSFSIVGLPEKSVKESKHRVRSALLNSHFDFPAKRITVNLSPADLPKTGSGFDLAIAIGILQASRQLPPNPLDNIEFIGELALGGELNVCRGILPAVIAAHQAKHRIIIPQDNAVEASLAQTSGCYAASHLLAVCSHLCDKKHLSAVTTESETEPHPSFEAVNDIAEVRGQAQAKRALEITASGGHSLLMSGPPGCGKTMLATRLIGLLPPLNREQSLEKASIASICGLKLSPDTWSHPPFRHPHHSASAAALVGGGSIPQPGEISLAHHGILFLDELPEFDRQVLEALREPLESGVICLSRAARQAEYPADFQLITAMNPCPCGQWGHGDCDCSHEQINRYINRLSGPLLDRLDIHLDVAAVSHQVLLKKTQIVAETSKTVAARVQLARERQRQRQSCLNARLTPSALDKHCHLDKEELNVLEQVMEEFKLSARATHRILRVARTIADMAASTKITKSALQEAISYRVSRRRLSPSP